MEEGTTGNAQMHFKQRLKTNKVSTLSDSIQLLCSALENELGVQNSITKLSQRFNIKRRRLYDIINVMISTGICEKGEYDCIIWRGKDQIFQTLKKLFRERHIADQSKTIDDLFPVDICVGVPNLTINFLLIYFALETQCLDIRIIATLFSRGTTRMKTTLSKLYQISYILCSIGITKRNTQVCEVILDPTLYDAVVNYGYSEIESENEKQNELVTCSSSDPLSLDFLLNRPSQNQASPPQPTVPVQHQVKAEEPVSHPHTPHTQPSEAVLQRREMFNKYFVENAFKADFVQQF